MKKKIISLILVVVMVLPLVPVFELPVAAASSGTTGDCTWTLKDGVLTISGNGAMGDYTYSNAAPWGTGITKVTIEDGVTSIGDHAFSECSGLASIIIPDSVTSIGENAFNHCHEIQSITIPNSVKLIAREAFFYCGLKSIAIPDSVTSIGDYAFSDCGLLKTATFGSGVTSIGKSIFCNCSSLTSIAVSSLNAIYHSEGNCLIETKNKTLIAGCKNSIIPEDNSVTSIGERAFEANLSLTSIAIPDSITFIGEGSFNFSALTDVWYGGSTSDRANIFIDSNNERLTSATWHYNACIKNPDTNKVHIYDNGCDTECNLCEAERTPPHQYDNACDATCNGCDSTRTVSHDYSVQDKNTETHWMKCSLCDDIDESTRDGHNYEKKGENIATCKACSLSKTFDFIITTDETITLSYEASKEFDFVIEDPSVAKINNVSSSIISMGSYYKQVSSAKVMSVFPGETTVKIVVTNGTVLTSSSLMVVEGQHQMQFSEVLKEPNGTEPGIELHICKFCGYEEEVEIPGYTPGDVDGVEGVTLDDAIYLLYHVNFKDTYPVNQPVDFNGDGKEDLDDAIYLLYHVNFKETYPLH